MRNHPDTIESLSVLIQDLVVTSPDTERPGWTIEQFQQALAKLHVPMSDQDTQDIYQYIDQKGDGDGILQHSDLTAVIEVTGCTVALNAQCTTVRPCERRMLYCRSSVGITVLARHCIRSSLPLVKVSRRHHRAPYISCQAVLVPAMWCIYLQKALRWCTR